MSARQRLMDWADLPLGHAAFLLILIGGFFWAIFGDLPPGDYVGAIGAASGLLAVGHGIRHHRRPETPPPDPDETQVSGTS